MLDNILTSIFKNAYPDKSDDEIASQISSLKSTSGNALHQALSFIPGVNLGDQVAQASPDTANAIGNTVLNSNTVQDAASGMTDTSAGNPLSGLAQGLAKGAIKDVFEPPTAETDEGPGPTPEDIAAPTEPPTPPAPPSVPAPTPSKQPSAKVPETGASQAQAAPNAPAAPVLNPSADNDARNAMLASERNKRMLGGLASAGAGIGDAMVNASGLATQHTQADVEKELNDKTTQNKAQFEDSLKNDPNSDISQHYQKVLGMMLGKKAGDPALTKMSAATIGQTLPEVEKYMQKELQLEAIKANKEVNLGFRHDSEQDRLEQNARQAFMSMRGDQSLQRIEAQRDASIQAFNTIDKVKSEGRMPSQIEYYDLLGQMWKARTGQAPSEQAIKDLDAQTLKGDLGKAQQYFTGAPAGRTTAAVLDNIQAFAKQSGQQADMLHSGYMQTRMVKPQNLDDSRWTPLANAGRGMSFADATKQGTTSAQPQMKSINGRNFINKNGQWFEVQ